MEVVTRFNDDVCDVCLIGKFIFSDNAEFRRVIEIFGQEQVSQVILHMAQLEFIDSAGLGMLLLALDAAESASKELVIVGAVGHVRKMLIMARFDTMFDMR